MAASSAAFKELKDHSVVVFLHSKDDKAFENVSPRVMADLHSARMGNTIPQAVVTDPDGKTTFAALNHDELGDSKTFRTVKRDVRDYLKGEKSPPEATDQVLYWCAKGKRNFWKGAFDKVTEKHLVLKMDGKEMKLPLDGLSEGARSFAKVLSGAPADEGEPAKAVELDFESWASSDGRAIEAKFVSLGEEGVKLVTKAGKEYTIPLSRLSEQSQSRAKELGAAAE